MRPKCENCDYWEPNGFCKKFTPKTCSGNEPVYPLVEKDGWCVGFKKKSA